MCFKQLFKADLFVCIAFFLVAAFGSYVGSKQLNLTMIKKPNVWFQADIDRVYQNMTDRYSDHYRTKVHPLFSLATTPAVYAISSLGISKEDSVKIIIASIAGIGLVFFYIILRLLSIPIFDSVIFSMLMGFSSASLFWATVPETYLFGSVTILAVLLFVLLNEKRAFTSSSYIFISAMSLSMTVTNWMAGVFATLANNSLRKSFRITVDAFVVVTVLWAIQHSIFPSAEFFLLSPEEQEYMLMDNAGSVLDKSKVFLIHSIVAPEVQMLLNSWDKSSPLISIQFSKIGSSGVLGFLVTICWISLLIVGIWSAWKNKENNKFKAVIASVICGQFFLHMIYGDETFLYSLHWTPLLVVVAAFGVLSHRRLVISLAIVTVTLLVINNINQFEILSYSLSVFKCQPEVQ